MKKKIERNYLEINSIKELKETNKSSSELVIKFVDPRSEKDITSEPSPSSNSEVRGDTINVKFSGTTCPALISNNLSLQTKEGWVTSILDVISDLILE